MYTDKGRAKGVYTFFRPEAVTLSPFFPLALSRVLSSPPSSLRYGGIIRAVIFIARIIQHILPSSTRVKLCLLVYTCVTRTDCRQLPASALQREDKEIINHTLISYVVVMQYCNEQEVRRKNLRLKKVGLRRSLERTNQ